MFLGHSNDYIRPGSKAQEHPADSWGDEQLIRALWSYDAFQSHSKSPKAASFMCYGIKSMHKPGKASPRGRARGNSDKRPSSESGTMLPEPQRQTTLAELAPKLDVTIPSTPEGFFEVTGLLKQRLLELLSTMRTLNEATTFPQKPPSVRSIEYANTNTIIITKLVHFFERHKMTKWSWKYLLKPELDAAVVLMEGYKKRCEHFEKLPESDVDIIRWKMLDRRVKTLITGLLRDNQEDFGKLLHFGDKEVSFWGTSDWPQQIEASLVVDVPEDSEEEEYNEHDEHDKRHEGWFEKARQCLFDELCMEVYGFLDHRRGERDKSEPETLPQSKRDLKRDLAKQRHYEAKVRAAMNHGMKSRPVTQNPTHTKEKQPDPIGHTFEGDDWDMSFSLTPSDESCAEPNQHTQGASGRWPV